MSVNTEEVIKENIKVFLNETSSIRNEIELFFISLNEHPENLNKIFDQYRLDPASSPPSICNLMFREGAVEHLKISWVRLAAFRLALAVKNYEKALQFTKQFYKVFGINRSKKVSSSDFESFLKESGFDTHHEQKIITELLSQVKTKQAESYLTASLITELYITIKDDVGVILEKEQNQIALLGDHEVMAIVCFLIDKILKVKLWKSFRKTDTGIHSGILLERLKEKKRIQGKLVQTQNIVSQVERINDRLESLHDIVSEKVLIEVVKLLKEEKQN